MNYHRLKKLLKINNIEYQKNVNLRKYNTMRIDAISRFFIEVETKEKLSFIIKKLNENHVHFIILGNGSNIVFLDKVIKLPIIKITFKDETYISDGFILVNGNMDNRKFANLMRENEIGNFTFLNCIPGSLSGSVFMNASCFDMCISDKLKYVEVMDEKGKIFWLNKVECEFSYRKSIFQRKNYIILRLIFASSYMKKEDINRIMNEQYKTKFATQPLDYPSAGSIFKNNSYKAFELIRQTFPKGLIKNGAKLSKKHANFIINYNKAKGKDVLFIIEKIRKKVYDKYGILLELEVVLVRSSKICGKSQEKRFKKHQF